jgi:hypothetical protein
MISGRLADVAFTEEQRAKPAAAQVIFRQLASSMGACVVGRSAGLATMAKLSCASS